MGILDTPEAVQNWSDERDQAQSRAQNIPQRKRVLMVHPHHFQISYAINPHMKTSDGKLRQVDFKKAQEQWKNLVQTFEECGLEVQIMDAHPQFPDMVFTANQSFPFWNSQKGASEILMSNMTHQERKGEVTYFNEFFKAHDYVTKNLPKEIAFEGTGDALLDSDRKIIFCGYGFRTHSSMPSRLTELTNFSVIPLELKNEDFYHLDTCLAPLNSRDAVVVREAFTPAGLKLIESAFQNVIYADTHEAKNYLAANLFCPNGKDIVVDESNTKLIPELKKFGYRIHSVDTSEFLKAGGSIFCLKLFYW